MENGINVVSCFDGIAGARIILDLMGVKINRYFSSEVDPYAMKIASSNYSDIFHLGSITDISYANGYLFKKGFGNDDVVCPIAIDLLCGGSPCTNLSIAGKRAGLGAETREEYRELKRRYANIKNGNPENEDEEVIEFLTDYFEKQQSHLFWEFVRLVDTGKAKVITLENVASMPKEVKDIITRALFGIKPIRIDSRLTSAQTRKRLYWNLVRQPDGTYKSIDIPQPEDAGILLKDILEDIPFDAVNDKGEPIWKPLPEKYIAQVEKKITDKSYAITATYGNVCPRDYFEKSSRQIIVADKSLTLTASYHKKNIQNFVEKSDGQMILGQFRRGSSLRIHTEQDKTCTLTANMGTGGNNIPILIAHIPEATKKGYVEVQSGDCVDMAQPQSATRRGRLCKDKMNTLTVSNQIMHVKENEMQLYWRPLTVRECARAQSIPDTYSFDAVSKSRAYKGIGNGWELEAVRHQWKYLLPFLYEI